MICGFLLDKCSTNVHFAVLGFGLQSQERNSNQGGPTQRASALAALNNAFNSSSPTAKTSPRPSSAGTQRAAAVAALSQVLTAEKKITPEGTPSQSPSAETKTSGEERTAGT